jgi:hypothetical protein
MIEFVSLKVSPDVPTYGGIAGEFTFVITVIGRNRVNPLFHATAKKVGATKFDGIRVELGHFRRFADATKACEQYYRMHSQ